MSRILVWDFPTRILHWLFAGALTGTLILGFAVADEHPLFAYHQHRAESKRHHHD